MFRRNVNPYFVVVLAFVLVGVALHFHPVVGGVGLVAFILAAFGFHRFGVQNDGAKFTAIAEALVDARPSDLLPTRLSVAPAATPPPLALPAPCIEVKTTRMYSKQLTETQVARLMRNIRRQSVFFYALAGRMHQRHFPYDDPLRQAADDAEKSLRRLADEVEKLATSERG